MPLAASVSTPPLLEGDSLTSDEFICRWEAVADLKHAELIDGIVYMPSPMSVDHGDWQIFLGQWLGFYTIATPGCRANLEATWLMGERQVPQPDVTLRILPEYGGQSGVKGLYASGAPELVVEVAASSRSRDFGAKKRLYEQTGVREYLIAAVDREEISWFERTEEGFRPLAAGADGILRSHCFPGLWLDPAAVRTLDLHAMNSVLQAGLATPEHARFVSDLGARKR